MLVAVDDASRRTRSDRRRSPASWSSVYHWQGRRKSHRRADETASNTLDRYDPQLLVPSLTILVLCVADALITLNLIDRGAVEINLVMRFLIEEGVVAFIATKYVMTASSVVWLVIHNKLRIFQRIPVQYLIYGCAGLYVSLLVYELVLLGSLVKPLGPL